MQTDMTFCGQFVSMHSPFPSDLRVMKLSKSIYDIYAKYADNVEWCETKMFHMLHMVTFVFHMYKHMD